MLHARKSVPNNKLDVRLSIVVPVYNLSDKINITLEKLENILSPLSVNYELVVVDDGSNDQTVRILQNNAAANLKMKIISYDKNMGKGHAIKTGILNSVGDVVLFTDGDLDINPDTIRDYVKESSNYDIIIASKAHPLSHVHSTLSRKFLSKVFNLIVQLLLPIKLKDTQSGMKAGKGDVLRKIFAVILVKRYAFDVELLTIARILNLRIKEMPVTLTLTNGFKIKEMLKMLVDVLAISYRCRIRHYYHKKLKIKTTS
jgi:glycosyltransferase involved in cell wall biosynthesis